MTKTVVFDLDDTIVKEIEYLKSAFNSIAKYVDIKNETLFEQMMEWYFDKQNVFQNVINQYQNIEIQTLKNIYRNHFPNFNSQSEERNLLIDLKNKGYKLGLITDGFSITQRNKIKALNIENLFDLIIISEEFGSEKPNKKNYEVFHQFKTDDYYYIGDNVKKDFVIPNELGWKTICILDDGNNIHKQDFNKEVLYLPQIRLSNLLDINL